MRNKLRKTLNNALNKLLFFVTLILIKLQRFLKLANWYHPNPFLDDEKNKHARSSVDRLSAFEPHLPNKRFTVMDIGCQEGYFLFKLSYKSGFALGIDLDSNALDYARSLSKVERIENTVFIKCAVSEPEDLDQFPDFDVVICMSIFHHWVKHLGKEKAIKILEKISSKTKYCLVFDTGEPSEITQKWASQMNFLLPSTAEYFEGVFKEFGFSEVNILGQFDTNLSPVKRSLFVAKK